MELDPVSMIPRIAANTVVTAQYATAQPPILPVVFESSEAIPEMIEKIIRGRTTIFRACSNILPGNFKYSISSESIGGSSALRPIPRHIPIITPTIVAKRSKFSFTHALHDARVTIFCRSKTHKDNFIFICFSNGPFSFLHCSIEICNRIKDSTSFRFG